MNANLALAFSAGMVATVNPCGFAMLPAYLSYFLGLEGEEATTGPDGSTTPPRAPVTRAQGELWWLWRDSPQTQVARAGTCPCRADRRRGRVWAVRCR